MLYISILYSKEIYKKITILKKKLEEKFINKFSSFIVVQSEVVLNFFHIETINIFIYLFIYFLCNFYYSLNFIKKSEILLFKFKIKTASRGRWSTSWWRAAW